MLNQDKEHIEILTKKYEVVKYLSDSFAQRAKLYQIANGVEKSIIRDATIKRFEWLCLYLFPFMQLYLRWIIGLSHDEPKNVVREFLRVEVLNQKQVEILLDMIDKNFLLMQQDFDEELFDRVADYCFDYSTVATQVVNKLFPRL